MTLNHLHLSCPDIQKGEAFFEDFFGFKTYCTENEGKFLLMRDGKGFVLAIHEEKERQNFPKWFHYGFCVNSREEVKAKYEQMKKAGIEFPMDYREDKDWAAFNVWAPGQTKLEVSWHNE